MTTADFSLVHAEFDGECREMVAENLGTKATLHSGTNPVRIEKMGSGEYVLVYKGSDGAEASITVDAVMMATGRTPRTDGLGLEVRSLPVVALLDAHPVLRQPLTMLPRRFTEIALVESLTSSIVLFWGCRKAEQMN